MSEFTHYNGCKRRDTDNCGACALTTPVMIDGKMGINYAGWPLSYMKNGRHIPNNFLPYLYDELKRTDNLPYLENLKTQLKANGYNVDAILVQFGNNN